MKTLVKLIEGYKKALRIQRAAEKNILAFIGKPSSETQGRIEKRNKLEDSLSKEKQKLLFRAVRHSMEPKGSKDLRSLNIARNIDDLSKRSHETIIKGLVKAEPNKEPMIRRVWPKLRKSSGDPKFFAPGEENIVNRLGDLHRAWQTRWEARDRPQPYFRQQEAEAKTKMARLVRDLSHKDVPLTSAVPMPKGNITLQGVSDMIRRIERSNQTGTAKRIGVRPGPEMTSLPLKHLFELDSKGQMHFDFEGARRAREKEEAAEDRRADKELLYGKKKPPKGESPRDLLRRLANFAKKK